MPALLSYCLKFSVSISLVFLFYQLVLRRLTFHNWNRYYLLTYSLLSFFVAVINITPLLQQTDLREISFVQWIPVINNPVIAEKTSSSGHFFSAWNMITLLLITGMLIMLSKLLAQLFSFR